MMVRSIEEKAERQRALKERYLAAADVELMTLEECAEEMKISKGTAWRVFRHEPGVKRIRPPGSQRPIIRVPRDVFERVLRRSTNPFPFRDRSA